MPCHKHTCKALRYSTCSQGISVLPAHPVFICWRNEPYLPLSSEPKLVLIYRLRRDGRLSWPWVACWLHTEINVRHRELNPDTIAHLSTNRAQRRLTSLIEANALTTMPNHQPKRLSLDIESHSSSNQCMCIILFSCLLTANNRRLLNYVKQL